LFRKTWIIHLFPDRTIDDVSMAIGRDVQQHMDIIINENDGEAVNGLVIGMKDLDDRLWVRFTRMRVCIRCRESPRYECRTMVSG
jgi:hypothetical protein